MMYCEIFALFSLLPLLQLATVASATDDDGVGGGGNVKFLTSFTARSLLQVSYKPKKGDTFGPHGTLEVEEAYDGERNLARVVVNKDTGHRVELYARPNDGLFMEAKFDEVGQMMSCKVANKRSAASGFLELFSELSQACDGLEGSQHLIGPSALIYRFRDELLAGWAAQAQAQQTPEGQTQWTNGGDSEGANNQTYSKGMAIREKLGKRRRLAVAPEPIEFTLTSPPRMDGTKVLFRRSDLAIEREPLLSRLASFVSYTDKGRRRFTIDLLSLREIDLAVSGGGRKSRDPFRLPAGFGCNLNAVQTLEGPAYRLDELWSVKLPVRSNWMSSMLYGASLQPDGAHLDMDLNTGLMRLEIIDQSINVVDAKRGIIYHKPFEMALGSSSSSRTNQTEEDPEITSLNNGKCFIFSTKSFLGTNSAWQDKGISSGGTEAPSLSHWHQLVGDTNHMIYLGRTSYQDRPMVHEFELAYGSQNQLPAYLGLLVNQSSADVKYSLAIARLYLGDSSGLNLSYYSKEGDPHDAPSILGFRVELLSRVGSDDVMRVSYSQEINFVEFSWALEEDGLSEQPLDVFDLRQCPLNKIPLSIDVQWMETINNDGLNTDVPGMDSFVAKQLSNYCFHEEIFPHRDFGIIGLERLNRGAHGVRVARYLIELAEYPRESIGFVRANKSIGAISRVAQAIDFLNGTSKTLFECLAWASQFAQSKAVAYSVSRGCLIFSEHQLESLTDENVTKLDDNDRYLLFVEHVEPLPQAPDGVHTLRQFLSEHLESINIEMKFDNQKPNQHLALVDGGKTLARDIRFSSFKMALASLHPTALTTTLKTHNGYRFADLDQSECNSLVQCQSHCEEELDCNAFSYCRYPDSGHEFCQLNITTHLKPPADDMTHQEDGEAAAMDSARGSQLVRDVNCEIHAKNYLHHFEPINSASLKLWESANAYARWHPVPNVTDKVDCASVCYGLQDNFSCSRFIFCPSLDQETQRCFVWLSSDGGDAMASENLSQFMEPVEMSTIPTTGCSFFKLKTTTLYRRTLDSSRPSGFEWMGGESLRQEKLRNVNMDKCAELCTDDTECQSFDYCRVESTSKPTSPSANGNPQTFTSLECVLLSGSIYGDDNDDDSKQMYLNPTASGESPEAPEGGGSEQSQLLEDRRQCNHYERSAAKRRSPVEAAEMVIKRALTHGMKTATGLEATSHTLSHAGSLFGAALLGLLLGVGAQGLATVLRSSTRQMGLGSWRRKL